TRMTGGWPSGDREVNGRRGIGRTRPGTLEPMLNMADGLARLGALAENPVVRTLATAFEDAGFDLAVVGGPVRDALLGRTTHDLDFTTNASPDEILCIVTP